MLFRSRALRASDAFAMLRKTVFAPMCAQLTDGTLLSLGLMPVDFTLLAVSTAILFAVSVLQERGMSIRARVLSLPVIPRVALLYAFMYFVIASFAGAGNAGFMYAIF